MNLVFAHPAIRQYRRDLFQLLDRNFNVRFLFYENHDHNSEFLKNRPLKNWRAERSFWFILNEALFGDYDIWIASVLNSAATFSAFPIVKLRGKKFFLFSEDWWWQRSLKSFLARPYSVFLARYSNGILAAGSRTRIFFINLGVDPVKIFPAFNATEDLGENIEPRKENRFSVLYLGRVVKYKGLDVLIRAFSRLEKQKVNTELLVVGDGDFKPRCLDLVRGLGVKNIKFISHVSPEETAQYYKQADCFVLPARFLWNSDVPAEAWGFTINEAMSCGLPVIATEAVAAADDLIEDGATGFKIPADDENSLFEKLALLYHNQSLKEKLGKAAQEKIKHFTPFKQYAVFALALENDRAEINKVKTATESVHGWLSDKEGECLYRLSRTAPGAIVEIGSWQGKSTIWLAKGSMAGVQNKVYAIDPHTGAPEQKELYGGEINTLGRFGENMKIAGVETAVAPLVKTSAEAIKDWPGLSIGLLFIDGSHLYEDVKLDFLLWSPFVPEGGIIAFHDSGVPGPSRVLEEFVYNSRSFRVIKVVDSLTVVCKVNHLSGPVYRRQSLAGFGKCLWRKAKLLLGR